MADPLVLKLLGITALIILVVGGLQIFSIVTNKPKPAPKKKAVRKKRVTIDVTPEVLAAMQQAQKAGGKNG